MLAAHTKSEGSRRVKKGTKETLYGLIMLVGLVLVVVGIIGLAWVGLSTLFGSILGVSGYNCITANTDGFTFFGYCTTPGDLTIASTIVLLVGVVIAVLFGKVYT